MWTWSEPTHTVPGLWKAWHQGITPSALNVRFIDEVWGAVWRRGDALRQAYAHRKLIVQELEDWAKRLAGPGADQDRLREKQDYAISQMEHIRGSYSLCILSRALRKQRLDGAEPGHLADHGKNIFDHLRVKKRVENQDCATPTQDKPAEAAAQAEPGQPSATDQIE